MKIQQTEFHVKAVGKESLDKLQLVPASNRFGYYEHPPCYRPQRSWAR